MIRASIAMATYNGEKYISDQINSIIKLMGEDDELVISYDASTDGTLSIIKAYEEKNKQVRVVINHNKPGVISNFNNALYNCKGKYIFLSDQDDIWLNNKIERMIECLRNDKCIVAVCNGAFIDENSNIKSKNTIFKESSISVSAIRNIISGTYWGCCMAFNSELLNIVLPLSEKSNICHDLWIGVLAKKYGKMALIDDICIYHRIHESNQTRRLSLFEIIENRISFVFQVCIRMMRKKDAM